MRLIKYSTAIILLTIISCSQKNETNNLGTSVTKQPISNNSQGEIMSKSSSRIPAPKIEPIVINDIRIEQIKNGLTAGFEQMGGYIAVYDNNSNALLWSLQVYDNQRIGEKEGDVQDVFFRSMKLQPNGNILIENEKRVKFEVNIETKSVVVVE